MCIQRDNCDLIYCERWLPSGGLEHPTTINHQSSSVPGGALNACHALSQPLFMVPGILEEALDGERSPEPCTCESEKQEGNGLSPAEVYHCPTLGG